MPCKDRAVAQGHQRRWRAENRERYLETQRAYRAANPEKAKEWSKANYAKRDRAKLREYRAVYRQRADVKEKALAANREYYARNRERRIAGRKPPTPEQTLAATVKLRIRRAANPEKTHDLRRRQYEANKALIKERANRWNRENLERKKENARRWGAENPGKVGMYGLARRARALNASGSHTVEERRALIESYHGLCVYCHGKATTLDHVVPLWTTGENDISNCAPACRSCNSGKKAHGMLVWLVKRNALGRRLPCSR